jgi:Arc/MetJ-type ribon-helix-helix transcriptional regulator
VRAFVDDQVAKGDYATASDFTCAVLRETQKRTAQEKLEKLLLEGALQRIDAKLSCGGFSQISGHIGAWS